MPKFDFSIDITQHNMQADPDPVYEGSNHIPAANQSPGRFFVAARLQRRAVCGMLEGHGGLSV